MTDDRQTGSPPTPGERLELLRCVGCGLLYDRANGGLCRCGADRLRQSRDAAIRAAVAAEREDIRLLAWKLPMPPQASDAQDQRKIALFVCDLDAAIRARGEATP